jgi:hypothetical protein
VSDAGLIATRDPRGSRGENIVFTGAQSHGRRGAGRFLARHQAYLGCAFAPNHKGMPILSHDDDSDFPRRQVLTARNVRGGWLVDFPRGGLNYQIEHHLFPVGGCEGPATTAQQMVTR